MAGILRAKIDHPGPKLIRPHPHVLPGRPRLTTTQPKRPDGSPLAENADVDVAAELYIADAAVSAAVAALASGTASDAEFSQDTGVTSLEGLRVGDSRIGHMYMHA